MIVIVVMIIVIVVMIIVIVVMIIVIVVLIICSCAPTTGFESLLPCARGRGLCHFAKWGHMDGRMGGWV